MTTKTASPKPEAAQQKKSRPQGVTAEAIPSTPDESAAKHQAQLDDLSKPGRASKTDAEQIDNDPGYSKDQLAHMREYWDTGNSADE